MNKCKNEACSNEPKGSSVYCSNTCKTIYNRNKSRNSSAVTPVTPAVTTPTVTAVTPTVTSQATRTNPDLINHGKPLSPHGLKKAGLKANRVAIPGDHDYEGVCVEVDGKWQVRA